MNPYEPFLTPAVRNALATHMVEDRTVECCGLITLSSAGEYAYERCANVSAEPAEYFEFSKEDTIRIMTDPAVVAFCHSHPNGPAYPSLQDMQTQKDVGKPAVIACLEMGRMDVFSFGNHLLDVPLDNRLYRPGAQDCFEYIRSYYWQKQKLLLPSCPRDQKWDKGKIASDCDPLYDKNFAAYGFKAFEPNFEKRDDPLHPRVGDAILMMIGSPVCNHAGIYLGDNLVGHHRIGKKSGPTPYGYIASLGYVRKWLRYE
jgi:proteasome lid subunit RPN8/RPN11